MKTTFKVTENGEPGLVLEPETNDERVLLNVFLAQCTRPGFRVGGLDVRNQHGTVTQTSLIPVRTEETVDPRAEPAPAPAPVINIDGRGETAEQIAKRVSHSIEKIFAELQIPKPAKKAAR